MGATHLSADDADACSRSLACSRCRHSCSVIAVYEPLSGMLENEATKVGAKREMRPEAMTERLNKCIMTGPQCASTQAIQRAAQWGGGERQPTDF